MFDLASALSLVIPATALVAAIVVVRRLSGDQPIDLAVLFGNAAHMPWPRGVQEEEPRPWRFDLLDRRPATVSPKAATNVAGTCRAEPSQVGV